MMTFSFADGCKAEIWPVLVAFRGEFWYNGDIFKTSKEMTPVKAKMMRKIRVGGKLQLSALLAVSVSFVFLDCAQAAVTWPTDFWTQVTNSMAIPAGSQIGCGSQTFAVAAASGDSVVGGTLGSAVTPFDSRWRTTGASLGSWLDSRPCGVVLTFR